MEKQLAAVKSAASVTEYTTTPRGSFPANWQVASDFDPNDQMMNLKGKDYLNVQSRMVWFIRDQRALIVAGLATQPYVTKTELVELDRQQGWAHFKTTVRDVLGNESVAYGSESSKDFGDYIEKAATKSLGRALVGLGYGTGMAPEMDEGERVVDSPIERRHKEPAKTPVKDEPKAPVSVSPATPWRAMTDPDVTDALKIMGMTARPDVERYLGEIKSGMEKAGLAWTRDQVIAQVKLRVRRYNDEHKHDLEQMPVGKRGN